MVDTLTHYCGSNVFLSFIQKKELWLTSLKQSNDAKEGTWMSSHWLNLPPNSTTQDRKLKRGLAACLDMALGENEMLGVCFSEEPDLLSQWRGYSNDGAGFSITFDRAILEKIPRNADLSVPLTFSKIFYGYENTAEINAVVKQLADAFMGDAKKYEEGDDYGSLSIDFGPKGEKHSIFASAAKSLFTVKNGAFKEEKEWRLFAFEKLSKIMGIKYRVSKEALSPYLPLSIPIDAIVGVTLGPTNSTPENVVKAVIIQNGLDRVWVRTSNASYRNK